MWKLRTNSFLLIFRSSSPDDSKRTKYRNTKDDKKSTPHSHYETEEKIDRKNNREKYTHDKDYSHRKRKEVPQEELRNLERRDDFKNKRKYDDAKKIKKETDIKQVKHLLSKGEESCNSADRMTSADRSHQSVRSHQSTRDRDSNSKKRRNNREWDKGKHNTSTDADNFRWAPFFIHFTKNIYNLNQSQPFRCYYPRAKKKTIFALSSFAS